MVEAALLQDRVTVMPVLALGLKEEVVERQERCSRHLHLQEARAGGVKAVTCGDSQQRRGVATGVAVAGGLLVRGKEVTTPHLAMMIGALQDMAQVEAALQVPGLRGIEGAETGGHHVEVMVTPLPSTMSDYQAQAALNQFICCKVRM